MANNQTIKGKNLDSKLVTLSDKPSIADSGAKYVYVGYNNKNLVFRHRNVYPIWVCCLW